MEARQIIAYLLLAGMILAVFVAYRYVTREHRAHHRAHKAANRRTRERVEGMDRS
jgi:hypothetical protein